jgi:hypothetical protein
VGVYKPAGDNSDEGWTRWLLEQYEFAFTSLDSALVRAGGLGTTFDAIILPSATADLLMNGLPKDTMPPGYGAGLGEEGVRELDAFVKARGVLICLDQAGGFASDAFKLPIRDVARQPRETFFGPGSLVSLEFDTSQPLAYGMPARAAGFFADGSAYDVPQDASVTTAARYAAKDVLVSGCCRASRPSPAAPPSSPPPSDRAA